MKAYTRPSQAYMHIAGKRQGWPYSPRPPGPGKPSYIVDTVRKVKRQRANARKTRKERKKGQGEGKKPPKDTASLLLSRWPAGRRGASLRPPAQAAWRGKAR